MNKLDFFVDILWSVIQPWTTLYVSLSSVPRFPLSPDAFRLTPHERYDALTLSLSHSLTVHPALVLWSVVLWSFSPLSTSHLEYRTSNIFSPFPPPGRRPYVAGGRVSLSPCPPVSLSPPLATPPALRVVRSPVVRGPVVPCSYLRYAWITFVQARMTSSMSLSRIPGKRGKLRIRS